MKSSNSSPTRPVNPRVGLFVTCLVDLYRPNVGFAAVKLLEDAGCSVEVPEAQTCCGQPALNSGDYATSRDIAKQVVEAFVGYDYVVGASGSCMGTIKTHYPDLFKDDPQWQESAKDLAARSHELMSFLTDVMGVEQVQARYDGTITYHDSCSGLRELGIKQQPRNLLGSVDGLEIDEADNSEICCGFGGTFCVKYPEISTRLVSDKVEGIEKTQATTLLGGDMGCLLNISGRLKRLGKEMRVYHTAEVLADMTDLPGIGDGEE
ncbi:MAG: (Fe-S)-binding protein [Gammaproteobacteria bacterium]|nr:(Fe-S)-binding protein [Gammaproteobacteria bacterium]